mmetsp:Transcript_5351/g.7473  ORF Transcript_5351/g.7473 Transcript_5351/m.7473 type:complete len:130 (+) Transcript_5351:867-1256(+)
MTINDIYECPRGYTQDGNDWGQYQTPSNVVPVVVDSKDREHHRCTRHNPTEQPDQVLGFANYTVKDSANNENPQWYEDNSNRQSICVRYSDIKKYLEDKGAKAQKASLETKLERTLQKREVLRPINVIS